MAWVAVNKDGAEFIYDEKPTEFTVKPKVRTYREKIIKNPIINKENRKKENMKKVLEKRLEEEKEQQTNEKKQDI